VLRSRICSFIEPDNFLAKVDLSAAYRSVRVHPADRHLTGLAWTFAGEERETVMVDTRLPFGARLSAGIFNSITQAVVRMMAARGDRRIVCYLDDFLIAADTETECRAVMNRLLRLLRELGFAVNYKKLVPPTRRLVFLGVLVDTDTYTLALPAAKMAELRAALAEAITRRRMSKRQLQSLTGKLGWAAQVIYGGRPHLRRLINRTNTLLRPYHTTRVTRCMMADLSFWVGFMGSFNGLSPILSSRAAVPVVLDACPSGGGGFYSGQWFHVDWSQSPEIAEKHINCLEALTLLPAVRLWGRQWADKEVVIYSDNTTAVSIFNKGTARDHHVMEALREIFWWSAIFNFRLRAIYYPGRHNRVADAASRLAEPGGPEALSRALSHTLLY